MKSAPPAPEGYAGRASRPVATSAKASSRQEDEQARTSRRLPFDGCACFGPRADGSPSGRRLSHKVPSGEPRTGGCGVPGCALDGRVFSLRRAVQPPAPLLGDRSASLDCSSLCACFSPGLGSVARRCRRSSRVARLLARRALSRSMKPAIPRPPSLASRDRTPPPSSRQGARRPSHRSEGSSGSHFQHRVNGAGVWPGRLAASCGGEAPGGVGTIGAWARTSSRVIVIRSCCCRRR